MNIIKAAHQADPEHNLRYCPNWTATKKSGHPKKNKRKKSILEKATGARKRHLA
jgi:hypothetical protein